MNSITGDDKNIFKVREISFNFPDIPAFPDETITIGKNQVNLSKLQWKKNYRDINGYVVMQKDKPTSDAVSGAIITIFSDDKNVKIMLNVGLKLLEQPKESNKVKVVEGKEWFVVLIDMSLADKILDSITNFYRKSIAKPGYQI